LFVIHNEAKGLAVRQGAGAALDRLLVRRTSIQRVKPVAKTNLRVTRLKFCRIAEAKNFRTSNDDRVGDRVGENRILAAGRKNIRGQYGSRGIFGARESEQISEIG
jgi:hypothetical protein